MLSSTVNVTIAQIPACARVRAAIHTGHSPVGRCQTAVNP